MSLSHIGIAVKDLNQAIDSYTRLLGSGPEMIEEVDDQQVKVAMFNLNESAVVKGPSRIELLQATSESSPLARSIAKRGEGLHHICLYVENLDEKLRELEQAGVKLIDTKPRQGAGGCRIAFVHPSGFNGVLLELQER